MKIITFLLCLFLISACTIGPSIRFDPGKILSWSEAKKDESTRPREVLYKFREGDKTLFYLAAGHGTSRKSKTFSAIDWVLEKQQINAAVVEGFPSSLGINSPKIIKPMKKGIKGNFYPNGEVSFVVIKSEEKGVSFIGGEPQQSQVLSKVKKKGYTENDYLGFLFLRALPQRVRSGETKRKSLKQIFTEYMAWKKREFSLSDTMSFDDFKSWYAEKQKKDFSLKNLEPGETAPLDSGQLFTHRISLIASRIRDESILGVLADMLNKYKTVFIVYGSSHYRLQHKALKDQLGNPAIVDESMYLE